MSYLLRGALIEYASDFLGPIPNVVIFQFNPESLSRSIEIPQRASGSRSRETDQAGEIPVEKITLKAYFSAADKLKDNNALARLVGIGPQLAALEKMVRPKGIISGALGQALDAIGDAISSGGSGEATQSIARENYPRILFIWGLTRVLPVTVDSMSIDETEFDHNLNPVQAEVSLGLTVKIIDPHSKDPVAKGASEYSELAKDAQAVANLASTITQATDLIPF